MAWSLLFLCQLMMYQYYCILVHITLFIIYNINFFQNSVRPTIKLYVNSVFFTCKILSWWFLQVFKTFLFQKYSHKCAKICCCPVFLFSSSFFSFPPFFRFSCLSPFFLLFSSSSFSFSFSSFTTEMKWSKYYCKVLVAEQLCLRNFKVNFPPPAVITWFKIHFKSLCTLFYDPSENLEFTVFVGFQNI